MDTTLYTQVSYIQSTGTQWINTGLTSGSSPMRIELDWAYTSFSSECSMVGANTSFEVYATSAGVLHWWQYGTGNDVTLSTISAGARYIITADTSTHKATVGSDEYNLPSATISNVNTIYLFAYTANRYPASGKLYSCKIYQGGTLARDFVPCVRISDSVAGLWDNVSETFFQNTGSGSFLYPALYTVVDYIESSGTQWIDTGCNPTSSTTAELSFTLSTWGNYPFFGANNGWDSAMFVTFTEQDNKMYCGYGAAQQRASISSIVGQRCTLSLSASGYYLNGTKLLDVSGSFSCLHPMYLLAVNVNGTCDNRIMPAKVFSFKVWESGTLIRNLVPCVRDVDSVVCMYDTITDTFYTNSGTGTFAAPVDHEFPTTNWDRNDDQNNGYPFPLNTNTPIEFHQSAYTIWDVNGAEYPYIKNHHYVSFDNAGIYTPWNIDGNINNGYPYIVPIAIVTPDYSVMPTASGPAKIATGEEAQKFDSDYTNPILMRRMYSPPEGSAIQYFIGVYGNMSYRTVFTSLHDEESTTTEIP